jgi:hypothetical protein
LPDFVTDGGMMSYAPGPTRFEFVINLKTSKELGIEVALEVRSIADEIVEYESPTVCCSAN